MLKINCKNSISLNDLIPSEIEAIKSLELENTNALIEINELAKAKNLENFAVKNYWMDYNSNSIDLHPLTKLNHLKHISIQGWQNLDAKPLKHITSLQFLSFGHCPQNLEELSKLPNLVKLSIDGANPKDLDKIKKFQLLKLLELGNLGHLKNFKFLDNLKQLEELRIDCNSVQNINSLSHLKSLKKLEIINGIDPWKVNLEVLNQLTSLKELYWPINALPENLKLKALNKITLNKDNENEDETWDITPLEFSKNLETIVFNLQGDEIFDFTPLSALKRLATLKLAGLQPDTNFNFLNELESIEHLEIEFWDISEISEVENYNELKNICQEKNINLIIKT